LTTEQAITLLDPDITILQSIPASYEDMVARILLTVVSISLYTLILYISLSFKTISRETAIREIRKGKTDEK